MKKCVSCLRDKGAALTPIGSNTHSMYKMLYVNCGNVTRGLLRLGMSSLISSTGHICGKYDEICGKYEEIWGKYEEICGKYVENIMFHVSFEPWAPPLIYIFACKEDNYNIGN